MKQRLDFIDLVKGVGMLMVIYLHISINYSGNPYHGSDADRMIHSMFMPVFFIVSGMFFSIRNPFKVWIKQKIKRLVVPFICFYLLTYLLNCIICGIFHIQTKNEFHFYDVFAVFYKDVFPNSAIWFLLAIFWSSLMFYVLLEYAKNGIYLLGGVILSSVIGLLLGFHSVNIPLYIDTAFTAVPFLYFGWLMKKGDVILRIKNIQTNRKYIIVFCIGAIGTIVDFCIGEGISMVNNSYSNPLVLYGGAISGSLAVMSFCFLIGKFPLVSFIGRNSMIVLCTHLWVVNAVVRIVRKVDMNFWLSSFVVLLVVCLSYYIIVPLLRKYVPFIIGE